MKKGFVIFSSLLMGVYLLAQTKPVPKKPVQTKTGSSKSAGTATTGLKTSLESGKKLYVTRCLACHQADGGGVPNMNPPLIKTKWVLGDKKKLITVILKGLNDPIEIQDDEFHNPMPPQPQLTDQEIADVLTYVRNSFGNKASAVTPAELKRVRGR